MSPDLEFRSAAMQAFLAKRQQAKDYVEHGMKAERTLRQMVIAKARRLVEQVERDAALTKRRQPPRGRIIHKTYDPNRQA
jgi:hypothetical protein